ncbi:MAG: hypothetical protein J5I50_04860 [Chitinophagaceae bacterium]|nr:hypothetical protein [Chitinophagaceae bacterium]
MPRLTETFKNTDKKPFGAKVVFDELEKIAGEVNVASRAKELPFEKSDDVAVVPLLEDDEEEEEKWTDAPHELFIIIAAKIYVTDAEAYDLIRYVRQGNDLFIAASGMSQEFLEQAGVKMSSIPYYLERGMPIYMDDTKVSLSLTRKSNASYSYFYYPFLNFFDEYPKKGTEILGVNEKGDPDFISIRIGSGHLYLHASPRVFSNYFLLTGNNVEYARRSLQYILRENTAVYWDEYLKKARATQGKSPDSSFSSMEVIMGDPFLKWAFILLLALLGFFIFSNIRRRQRTVPVKKEIPNDSVDFAETMGRLYFLTKDNKNISTKMTGYFRENVRTKFFTRLSDPISIEEDALRLSQKSGRPLEQMTELLNCIKRTESSDSVSDEELLMLNLLIEKFYKQK